MVTSAKVRTPASVHLARNLLVARCNGPIPTSASAVMVTTERIARNTTPAMTSPAKMAERASIEETGRTSAIAAQGKPVTMAITVKLETCARWGTVMTQHHGVKATKTVTGVSVTPVFTDRSARRTIFA